jgi:outer membrane lipoprotein carrier protein
MRKTAFRGRPRPRSHVWRSACIFISLMAMFLICAAAYAAPADFGEALSGMEKRYASADTAAGNFKQIYRAPGITREETGVFRLKRPGLMRWEYRTPEEKLFVADGKDCFLYAPLDRQVTTYPLTPADLARTPIAFLLGGGNVRRDYRASEEMEFRQAFSDTILLRLTPVRDDGEYGFVTLELDAKNFDIRRVVIREQSGSTYEFLLSEIVLNGKTSDRDFQFKPPRGVEIVRMQE